MAASEASSGLIAWMPLFQGLIGALGGLAVAAFTVYFTNRAAAERAAKQVREEREVRRRDVLRAKAEEAAAAVQGALDATMALYGRLKDWRGLTDDQRAEAVKQCVFQCSQQLAKVGALGLLYFEDLQQPLDGLLAACGAVAEQMNNESRLLIQDERQWDVTGAAGRMRPSIERQAGAARELFRRLALLHRLDFGESARLPGQQANPVPVPWWDKAHPRYGSR
ncbi:hypothetical protein [Piscinibacterium candidicorallinum]|uniref:Uncharacterized protein n=1 Tax=Piscinibacterium candidicorallinum TaxID=1793872 RepID=A0ABV7H2A6_9BURK